MTGIGRLKTNTELKKLLSMYFEEEALWFSLHLNAAVGCPRVWNNDNNKNSNSDQTVHKLFLVA